MRGGGARPKAEADVFVWAATSTWPYLTHVILSSELETIKKKIPTWVCSQTFSFVKVKYHTSWCHNKLATNPCFNEHFCTATIANRSCNAKLELHLQVYRLLPYLAFLNICSAKLDYLDEYLSPTSKDCTSNGWEEKRIMELEFYFWTPEELTPQKLKQLLVINEIHIFWGYL